MKATKVDKDLCIGCGLCCGICDEVFRMNEQGKAEAYQPANAENQGAVQEAIDSQSLIAATDSIVTFINVIIN